MKSKLSHVDKSGNPRMVNVSGKRITSRMAQAQASVWLGDDIVKELSARGNQSDKGAVFQTAALAGVMGSKKTADLIPLCHPLSLDDCQVEWKVTGPRVILTATARIESKTGVEMEALTAVTIAALTVYDMCKAMSHDLVIEEVKLLRKTGGKSDYRRK